MKQGWYELRASRCYTLRIGASKKKTKKTYSVMITEVNGYIHMQTGKQAENLNKWLQLNWLRFLKAVWFRSSNIKHALVFLRPVVIFTVIKFCSFKYLIGFLLFKVIWNISNIAKIIWIKATYMYIYVQPARKLWKLLRDTQSKNYKQCHYMCDQKDNRLIIIVI